MEQTRGAIVVGASSGIGEALARELAAAMPSVDLVGVSSVASHFGNGGTQAYNASKAFVSTYLEGLRTRAAGNETDVTITTVEPGFVDTELSYGSFWECSPETSAKRIARAIRTERDRVYVTRRWRLVAWAFEITPDPILRRVLS